MAADLKIDALFFDFDGTLGDTAPEIRGSWQKAIAKLGLECPDFDRIFRVGPSLQETSKMLFPEAPLELRETLQNTYRSFYDDSDLNTTRPYPWVEAVLQEFISRGKRLYIVTNKRFIPTMKLMKNFDFNKYFSGIFVPDLIPDHRLTKNELLALAVRTAAISPERALMIGDTELDIMAAKYANTNSCAVTWGYGDIEKLKSSQPDLMVTDNDLLRAFDRFYK